MVVPSPMTIMLSAFAAGSRSSRTRRGTMALRAEPLTPAAADCTATRPYNSHTLPTPSQACRAMPMVTSQSTVEDIRATRRRSWASAMAPP